MHKEKYPEGTVYSKLPWPLASALPDEIENCGEPKLKLSLTALALQLPTAGKYCSPLPNAVIEIAVPLFCAVPFL